MINKKTKHGILLYVLILLGYFVFGMAWIGVGNLKGGANSGWLATYFGGESNIVVEQTVNYVISFMGGIGSIGAGWLLVKVGHKYSVIISMALISISIISPWLHQDVADGETDYIGFTIFILSRTFMSLGGTIIIIYIQPIIAKYIENPKTKQALSRTTPMGYNCAVILSYLLVSISPEVSEALFKNWQIVVSCLGLPIIPILITYIVKAKNFENDNKQVETKFKSKITLKSVFMDKNTLILSGIYAIWLIIAIIPIIMFPTSFVGLSTAFSSNPSEAYLKYFNWGGIYVIVFMAGLFIGMFTVATFNKTKIQRKWFMMGMFLLAILGFAGSIIGAMFGLVWVTLAFGLLSGIILWGMQGLIWTIPFEMKNQNPEKIGLTFSLMSSIGYFGLTIFNIIFALLADNQNISLTIPSLDNSNSTMQVSQLVFLWTFVGLSLLSIPLILFLPKSYFSDELNNENKNAISNKQREIKD